MAEITGYTLGNAAYRAKLLALGMTRGTQVKILNVAPLGETLGALGVDVGYMYEYMPRLDDEVGDTQYFTAELSLGDLWLEPTLAFERDIMADNGTYVNFEIGHTFGAYIAYYDYLFDGNMREAAAAYNGEWGAGEDKTWNVVGGLSLTATF